MFKCVLSAPFLCHCNVKPLHNGAKQKHNAKYCKNISSISHVIQNVSFLLKVAMEEAEEVMAVEVMVAVAAATVQLKLLR